ncbi:MAG: amidohydrolase family protein, partial [Gemmatimonadota bacterium]|nr:amidohydrolase family protein [Gemmatimonadota bacterium]
VMGDDFRRPATEAEVGAMAALLEDEMESGALGLSTGLEYDPGIYSTTEEVVTLARVAAAAGGRYISHVRSEDRDLGAALDEAIAIGEAAGIPVQISHMKLAMRSLWGRADEFLRRLEEARARGVEVTADVYPYEYWQSTMTVLFPDRDFTDRDAARFALEELVSPEGMLIGRFEADRRLEGMTLAEIAADRGTDPVTAYLALIAESQAHARETGSGGESIVATSMSGGDIARLLAWEHTVVSSDGALDGAHPRGFGTYPRVLGRYVREQSVLSLEEAVHKMTLKAATHVGLNGRGVILPGAPADLVLFDPSAVIDRATPASPHETSVGIKRVWVGGVLVYTEAGGVTGARPGQILRRGARPRF